MSSPDPGASPPQGVPVSVRGTTIGGGTLGFLGMVAVWLLGLLSPGYGSAWLDVMASLYPGFDNSGSAIDLLIGTGYAVLHWATVGFLFGKFHNSVTRLEEPHEMFFCWPCMLKHFLGPWVALHKRH